MSEVTIDGLADWLERVGKLGERAEAANDKFRAKTGDEADELYADGEEFADRLQQMVDVVTSLRDALYEVVSLTQEYSEMDRSEKEDGRAAIAGALDDLNGHMLAFPWMEDEETE